MPEHVIPGYVTYAPLILTTNQWEEINTVKKESDINEDFFKYLDYLFSLESINQNSPSKSGSNADNLIMIDLLSGNVFQTLPRMDSLHQAIVNHFVNGIGKKFCIELSYLCSKGLCMLIPMPHDTRIDGIKLFRNKVSEEWEESRYRIGKELLVGRNLLAESIHNSTASGSFNKSNEGYCVPDVVMFNETLQLPLIIFEVKSRSCHADVETGIAQLVSYGLALRDNRKIPYKLKLVLITPKHWCLASLPPYQEKPLNNFLEIDFVSYGKFGILHYINEALCLDRIAYIGVLMNLRQHFESVKSWCKD